MEKLVEYLKREIELCKGSIIDRANEYNIDKDNPKLWDIDTEIDMDMVDLENHNWDLSRMRAFNDVLDIINKQNN